MPPPLTPVQQLVNDATRLAQSASHVLLKASSIRRDTIINRTSKFVRDNQSITNATGGGASPYPQHVINSLLHTILDIPSVSLATLHQQPSHHSYTTSSPHTQQQYHPSPSQRHYQQHQYPQQQQYEYQHQQQHDAGGDFDIPIDDSAVQQRHQQQHEQSQQQQPQYPSSHPQQHQQQQPSSFEDIPIASEDVSTAVSDRASSVKQKAQNVADNLRKARDIVKPVKLTQPVEDNEAAVTRQQTQNAVKQQIQQVAGGAQLPSAQPSQQQQQTSQQPAVKRPSQHTTATPSSQQQPRPTQSTDNAAPPKPAQRERDEEYHIPSATDRIPLSPSSGPQSVEETKHQFDTAARAESTTIAAAMPQEWKPREIAVPSTQFGRVWGFGKMIGGMAIGTVADRFSYQQPQQSQQQQQSGLSDIILSSNNAERLAEGLCRMRGAALKVGQILSIQDESVLPPQLQAIFDRVRDRADVMPRRQLDYALQSELGDDWRDRLDEFDFTPIAAASIGQVHRAKLLPEYGGNSIVMKVQYPGVADSINSDINNVKRMITWLNFVPKGFYLEETMNSAKEELGLECDYVYEAKCQRRYRELMAQSEGSERFHVPQVIDEFSTKRVLSSEMVTGIAIDRLAIGASHEQPQAVRDQIAFSIVDLCIKELFIHRFMQTDPNWSNFLYNPSSNVIHLIDFGACRDYDKLFVDEYMRMVKACADRDREQVIEASIRMGFLTGEESKQMLDAHVEAGFIIGEPFRSEEPYDFVQANIPARVSKLAAVMLKLRLTPPPKEAYTLHRKLSGAFLTARKLHAKIQCRDAFMRIYDQYQFSLERYDSRTMKHKVARLAK